MIRSEILPLISSLRKIRQSKSISQEVLDDLIGCTGGLVAKMESGARNPSLIMLCWWAEALGATISIEGQDAQTDSESD